MEAVNTLKLCLKIEGTFKKYVCLKFPGFDPPPPYSPLLVFEHTSSSFPPVPPIKVRSFWLELSFSPSISILVKFREKKLIMSNGIFG